MKKTFSKDGTAIAFDQTGSGPPIILVDGAFCSRSFGPMPKLAALLAQHFTVFTYDRRGRGESSDTKPYAKEREIEDIEALIKHAGGSAFVLGLSSGAALALDAAASGLNITKVAAYEPPFMVNDGGYHAAANHEAQLSRLIAAGRRGEAVKYFMRKMIDIPAIFVFLMRLMPGMWSKLKAVAHTLPYDAAVMGDFSLPTRRLASIKTPTLAIDGEKTDVRLRDAVQAVAAAVPNAQRRTLKGQTHNVKADVLTPVLVEFFTGKLSSTHRRNTSGRSPAFAERQDQHISTDMEEQTMNPVVHFEMPYDDRERMAKFYGSAFGWQTKMLGKDMGEYVLATTTQTGERGPQKPGAINGGFFQKNPDWPAQYPSVVIAVDDIKESMKKVKALGGQVLGEPMDIPGVGQCVSFTDTEGNRVSMLQPIPRNWHAPESK